MLIFNHSLGYLFFIILSVVTWPVAGLADDLDPTQCQLTVEQKVIDYGRIARSLIKYQSSGESELPQKTGIMRLICSEDIEPILTINGLKGIKSGFLFGQKSHLEVNLERLIVDGETISTDIIRNNVRHSGTQLEPNDVVQPTALVKGKKIDLIFTVKPFIHIGESIQPDDSPKADDIRFDFHKKVSDSFSVVSTFSSASCTPMISSGGVIDYGVMTVNQLSSSGPTVLPAKSIIFSVQCDGATNVAIKAQSNRPNSLIDIKEGTTNTSGAARVAPSVTIAGLGKNLPFGLSNINEPDVAGLGISGGKKIGGYLMVMPTSEMLLDGIKVSARYYTKQAPKQGISWIMAYENDITGGSIFSGDYYFGYSTDRSKNFPQPFTSLTAKIIIQTYITDIKNLNLSSPVYLDGSSKIELYYY
ncbi:DUF1120 domain-containing protein [Providencia rustigianii]|uniref:DUF1120 domain-containing protein n=2 Tax=Providencia rustigianii TaxID=158850 RepID=UPI0012B65934|nr:DUF1120 domain-containing protein [Providencia rustigianii]MTC61471.1 DUF1120 domain-containing protein [Providencia rustigianii]